MTTVAVPELTEVRLPKEPTAPSGLRARPNDWWGMLLLVATEATLFLMLLVSYFYIRYHTGADWPPGEIANPKLPKALLMTAVIMSSSVPVYLAERGIRAERYRQLRWCLIGTFVLGLVFFVVQTGEYRATLKEFEPTDNAYGSLFFTITGIHAAHVAVGLLLIAWTVLRAWRGSYTRFRHVGVQTTALYWHFAAQSWPVIFAALYLSPYA